MLVHRTTEKKVFWEFDSIIMQSMSHDLLFFCAPTWPSHHMIERNVGCLAPSPCRPNLRRPNLTLTLDLSWGDVTWGDKAMGRHNLTPLKTIYTQRAPTSTCIDYCHKWLQRGGFGRGDCCPHSEANILLKFARCSEARKAYSWVDVTSQKIKYKTKGTFEFLS